MSRGLKKTAAGAACCLFAVVFAVSVITNGVCLCSIGGAPVGDGGRYVVSLDVCGAGTSSATTVQGMDVLAVPGLPAAPCVLSISVIPPTPDPAVASAEPGEMDKPPEA